MGDADLGQKLKDLRRFAEEVVGFLEKEERKR